jgi:ribosome-interacting GTPase 1
MPANLTPEYKAAEAEFRRARAPEDRLHWLKEMLRTIPKHKGTDHLQADIKTRIRELSDQLTGPRKGAARGGPPLVIRPEGAAQIAMIGPPNAGKSALHARLTGSHTLSGPYPFTTQSPLPGMLPFEDITFQLVDLPSISPEHPIPWIGNALQPSAGTLLVMDLADPDCIGEIEQVHEILAGRRVHLISNWPIDGAVPESDDPFAILRPVLLLANKCDLIPAIEEELSAFREITGYSYPEMIVSAETGMGLDQIGEFLFSHLGIMRVYTKVPGHAADLTRPYTLRRGQTVRDVAELVHRSMAASLRFARVWGPSHFDGQQVGPEHVVADGDILELHV